MSESVTPNAYRCQCPQCGGPMHLFRRWCLRVICRRCFASKYYTGLGYDKGITTDLTAKHAEFTMPPEGVL